MSGAQVLHPRHKLTYFKRLRWTDAWRRTARKVIVEEYKRSYAGRVAGDGVEEDAVGGAQDDPEVEPLAKGDENIFDKLDTLAAPRASELRNKLERYLAADPEHAPDAIQWWIARRAVYPNLSRMALDYLSIPATSVDVKRVFSRGRLLLHYVRNRLSAQTTRALLCLGYWSDLGLIEPKDAQKAAQLADLDLDDSDYEMEEGWDAIDVAGLDD